jgi:hypothetical protein
MEYARTADASGNLYQWVDEDLCMFLDSHTGSCERLFAGCAATGTFYEAMEIIKRSNPASLRVVLVKVHCIGRHRLAARETDGEPRG